MTREVLAEWIDNEGLERLVMEGYLDPDQADPNDGPLVEALDLLLRTWSAYEKVAAIVERLVDEALA